MARALRRAAGAAVAAVAIASVIAPAAALAAAGAAADAPALDGRQLGLLWVLPFATLLAAIAVLPLLAPHFWHLHYGKVAGACALGFLVPCAVVFGFDVAIYELLHTVLLEYVPFVVLLLALFTVAGGVRITGTLIGTPLTNTAVLAAGTLAASWMGTTGACMLLVHPLIRANRWRARHSHVFVFFIFLVGNVGGALTPLGDPPLFIGFLQGIDFFWVTTRLAAPMLVLAVPLLLLFFVIDVVLYRREGPLPAELAMSDEPFGIDGKRNLALLVLVVATVVVTGVWKPGWGVEIFHVPFQLDGLAGIVALLVITWISWRITRRETRTLNQFTWFPMLEVAKLFFGIFLTIVPAIAIIRAGADGAARDIVALVNPSGQPDTVMYFWVTGFLSSVLDNAPTYLLFYNLAGGDAQQLMGPLSGTLAAISAGAVFMGALTYLGNAPNFMVRAIASERGIRMPSFFGYAGWAMVVLLPLLGLASLVFMR